MSKPSLTSGRRKAIFSCQFSIPYRNLCRKKFKLLKKHTCKFSEREREMCYVCKSNGEATTKNGDENNISEMGKMKTESREKGKKGSNRRTD